MTPKIIGLIQEEKVVNSTRTHSATDEMENWSPNTKKRRTINGAQQIQNPKTATKSTLEVLISWTVILPGRFVFCREGTIAVLCCLITIYTLP